MVGILYQEDGRLSPEERVRSAVAACVARHGQPLVALVRPDGYEWPQAIDGVRIEPSATVAYPTWVLLSLEESYAHRAG